MNIILLLLLAVAAVVQCSEQFVPLGMTVSVKPDPIVEGQGTVVGSSSEVTTFKAGDKVAFPPSACTPITDPSFLGLCIVPVSSMFGIIELTRNSGAPPLFTASGRVLDAVTLLPVTAAVVIEGKDVLGNPMKFSFTAVGGAFTLTNVPMGTYTTMAIAANYVPTTGAPWTANKNTPPTDGLIDVAIVPVGTDGPLLAVLHKPVAAVSVQADILDATPTQPPYLTRRQVIGASNARFVFPISSGLAIYYYSDTTWTNQIFRDIWTMEFTGEDLQGVMPIQVTNPGGAYSVKWTGFLFPPVTGSYVIRSKQHDDGLEIFLNGNSILAEAGFVVADKDTDPFVLNAGTPYPFEVRLGQGGGGIQAQIQWKGPGMADFANIPVTAMRPPAGQLANGLFAQYFPTASVTGTPLVTRFEAMNLVRPDMTADGVLPAAYNGQVEDLAVKWTGYLDVPSAGTYTFKITHDNDIRITLDNTLLAQEGLWSDHEDIGGPIQIERALSAGRHPLTVELLQQIGGMQIQIEWRVNGGRYAPIPLGAFLPRFEDPKSYDLFAVAFPPSPSYAASNVQAFIYSPSTGTQSLRGPMITTPLTTPTTGTEMAKYPLWQVATTASASVTPVNQVVTKASVTAYEFD